MAGTTITPELIVSLATLITAITALARVLMTHQTVTDTNETVHQVAKQTNGVMTTMQQKVSQLEQAQAAQSDATGKLPPLTP